MGRILNILLYPIRKQPYLFTMVTLLHLIIVGLCATRELGVHPLCAMGFTWIDAYLLCLLATGLKKIRMDWLVWVAYSLLATTDIVCVLVYDTLINVNVLQLIQGTNPDEAKEFAITVLEQPMAWLSLPTAAAVGLLTWSAVWIVRKTHRWVKNTIGSILLVLIVLSAVAEGRCYVRCVRCFTAPNTEVIGDSYYRPYLYSPIVRTAFACSFVRAEQKEMELLCQSIQQKTVTTCEPINPTIVVVVGESFGKHHCGLYEPEWEKVNPRLCEWRDKAGGVVFADMVSPSNMTSHVMRHFLSTWSAEDENRWEQHTLWPVVFRQAGWKVTLLSNQYTGGNNDQWNIIGGTLFNNPTLKRAQFDWANTKQFAYDEEILSLMPERNPTMEQPELVLIHLMGQHVEYRKRYPEKWNIFRAEDMRPNITEKGTKLEKAKQIMAEYANATLYNDYVVDSIWRIFNHEDAIMLYFSDHGEEVYDYRNFHERSDETHIDRNIARYQFEIPMFVMMSEQYQTNHPNMAETIRAAAQRPGSNEDLCHMLFYLAGIETGEYRASRNILSEDYEPHQRIIGAGFDYDELVQQWTD